MKPLNYAILKHFTKVKEASAEDVIDALRGEYGKFKALNKEEVINALMTAEANGLLEESRFELNNKGELRIYFRAHAEGEEVINNFIES
ncbi:conserved hypothetical protein [Alkaliphilus metalliredigens QYMF]|uniref:Uncharacterized protein n=1 Tax=Alkaliphilus metalliredigens (strain QYMF) TaxID=293826 RepID=A6TUT8_ALKMQ|nr:hypothetical protein [Alkaliphilus metalliredigens]ABR49956.1 conserved hypothetical protein [Alkaliphilus metalliredigens QYMF]